MEIFISYFPKTYVLFKRASIALYKINLVVLFAFNMFKVYSPCLKALLRVLFSKKCSLKKLDRVLGRVINLKGVEKNRLQVENHPKGFMALSKKWEKDFRLNLSLEKEEELKHCIINQQTKSVALFCTHPRLVLSPVSFDNPLISHLLSLAIEHNNKPCINMLSRNFWPLLQKSGLFRMRLSMGLPKEKKKFFKKAKKIYQHPRQTYGYMMLFATSGNIVLLREFIQKAPWFEGLPSSIQEEVNNLAPLTPKKAIQAPQNFSLLFKKNWFNLATQQEESHQEPSLQRLTRTYQSIVPPSFLKIIPHLPFMDYACFNTCVERAINEQDYERLRNQLLNPPVGFSLCDFTPVASHRLINMFQKGALSPSSFNTIPPLKASWKNVLGVGENYHSLSWDHLALNCLTHPKQKMPSKNKKRWLSNPLNLSSKSICENVATRFLIEEGVQAIVLEKQEKAHCAPKRKM